MASLCDQELCPSWTGDGCICEVLDLPRPPPEIRVDLVIDTTKFDEAMARLLKTVRAVKVGLRPLARPGPRLLSINGQAYRRRVRSRRRRQ